MKSFCAAALRMSASAKINAADATTVVWLSRQVSDVIDADEYFCTRRAGQIARFMRMMFLER